MTRDARSRYFSESIPIARAKVKTYLTEQKRLYIFFRFDFKETYPIALLPELFTPARQALRKHLRGLTILKALVLRRGDKEWRSISSTIKFDSAFGQISFNVQKWLTKDEYDSIGAVEIKVRVPRKWEKALGIQ